ncbi:hypothetical protein B5S33_g4042 [[Candida] boidinii]|nr:hypothetical protein B5S30_g3232 [[Candida] boidinii]OWB85377.1 hypothetical protein B5S33_g4042 [[Candida] boidinii]
MAKITNKTVMSIEIPALPEGYSTRRVEKGDYHKGYLKVLSGLTTVGEVSEELFSGTIDKWDTFKDIYQCLVVLNAEGLVVGTGNIIIEQKIIHGCSKVGHIEDISIDEEQQGKKLGLILIRSLLKIGKESGCYKVILDCDSKNTGFYEKCGLKLAGIEMEYRP